MITREPAIYEPRQLNDAKADLSRRYPDFDPDGALAELRRTDRSAADINPPAFAAGPVTLPALTA